MSTISTPIEHSVQTSLPMPFKPAAWINKIDFINHLVLLNNVLVAVLADEGGGKTTFAQLLNDTLSAHVNVKYIPTGAQFNTPETMQELYEFFSLRAEREPNLADFADQINERKAHSLIIVDDAHLIPADLIRQILTEINNQKGNSYLHWCFMANFNLLSILNTVREGFDNLIHTIELGGLSESETRTYLLKNLIHPKRIDKTMSDKRLEQFYQLTGGSISRINLLMNDFFNPGLLSTTQPQRRSRKLIKTASALSLGAIACYFALQFREPMELPAIDPIPQLVRISQPADVVAPALVVKEFLKKEALVAKAEPSGFISYVPSWTIASLHQGLVPPPLKKLMEINIDEDDDLGNMVVMDKVVVIPKTVDKQGKNALSQTVKPAGDGSKAIAISRILPVSELIPGQAVAKPSNLFTIQLLSSPNLVDIKRYVQSHTVAQKGRIYKTLKGNKAWYVLTMGSYADRHLAQKAISNLPNELTRQKPWVRTFSALEEIA